MYDPFLRPLKAQELTFYAAQVLTAIADLHRQDYIHRDIKPENLLLDQAGNLRVIDFGFSKKMTKDRNWASTLCGTPQYMAPEIVKGSNYGREIDWWALGVLIYEMAFGKELFSGNDPKAIYLAITEHKALPDDKNRKTLMHLINGLVNPSRVKRLGSYNSGATEI
jgi:serine/threonine protein kinase